MNDVVSAGIEKVATEMIVGAIKSVARHNKRAAEILDKTNSWIKELNEHNSFLNDLINILSPVIGYAKGLLEKLFPAYVHIADWIYQLITDVASGLAS